MQKKRVGLFVLCLCVSLTNLGWWSTVPFFALYLHKHVTDNPMTIGFILSFGQIMGMSGGFLSGLYADYILRKIRLLSIIAMIISACFAIFSTGVGHFLLLFMGMHMILMFCYSAITTVTKTLIAYTYQGQQDEKVLAYGMWYTASNIGILIGPLIGAWLSSFSFFGEGSMIFSTVVYGLSSLILSRILPIFMQEPNTKRVQVLYHEGIFLKIVYFIKVIKENNFLMYLIVISILHSITNVQIFTTLPLVIVDRFGENDSQIIHAGVMSVDAILSIALGVPLSRLMQRFSAIRFCYLSGLFIAVGFLVVALSQKMALFFIGIIVVAIGNILFALSKTVFIDRYAPQEHKGLSFGVDNIGRIGRFFGATLGGVAMAHTTSKNLYTAVAFIALLIICSYYLLQKKQYKQNN